MHSSSSAPPSAGSFAAWTSANAPRGGAIPNVANRPYIGDSLKGQVTKGRLAAYRQNELAAENVLKLITTALWKDIDSADPGGEEALAIAENVALAGISPDVPFLIAVLETLGRKGAGFEKMSGLLDRHLKAGQPEANALFDLMLRTCAQAPTPKEVSRTTAEVMNRMRDHGAPRTFGTYLALIDCCEAGANLPPMTTRRLLDDAVKERLLAPSLGRSDETYRGAAGRPMKRPVLDFHKEALLVRGIQEHDVRISAGMARALLDYHEAGGTLGEKTSYIVGKSGNAIKDAVIAWGASRRPPVHLIEQPGNPGRLIVSINPPRTAPAAPQRT